MYCAIADMPGRSGMAPPPPAFQRGQGGRGRTTAVRRARRRARPRSPQPAALGLPARLAAAHRRKRLPRHGTCARGVHRVQLLPTRTRVVSVAAQLRPAAGGLAASPCKRAQPPCAPQMLLGRAPGRRCPTARRRPPPTTTRGPAPARRAGRPPSTARPRTPPPPCPCAAPRCPGPAPAYSAPSCRTPVPPWHRGP